MADDCGDCGDCGDCDCNCDGCDCDCNCDDCNCDCDCLDNCCTGETNVILCCFLPSSNGTRRTRHDTADCSFCFWCTDRNERIVTSRTSDRISKNTRRKGFCSRLGSCFGRKPSPPSSPTRDQTKVENVPPKVYNQDGRYPMNDGRSEMTQLDYEEQRRRRASWEELGNPPREYRMDGKWSSPMKHGDRYVGHL